MRTIRGANHSFSLNQKVAKASFSTPKGVVAAQHRKAAEIGADVLAAGGSVADAAVAVSFAIGVLEPWMSGPAGGGAAVFWHNENKSAESLSFGPRAPASLDVSNYPLDPDGGFSDLFPWPAVSENRNVHGGLSIGVPGVVSGAWEAHHRYGKMPWRDLLSPAIELAREGLHVDWYAPLVIASAARDLSRDDKAAATFLDQGVWPKSFGWTALSDVVVPLQGMAMTLSQLADAGGLDFYRGSLAEEFVLDAQDKGSPISIDDLRSYRASWNTALTFSANGALFHAVPELSGGPSLMDAFAHIGRSRETSSKTNPQLLRANAIKHAYAKRLENMGDVQEPQPSCTTHFSIVDRYGNMISWTQTLLSIFGARVMGERTGLLMNNGIFWFDPIPGRPNSIGPGKRCLMNICPIVFSTPDGHFALGASGGRKILPCVFQLADYITSDGCDLEAAIHRSRFDLSGGDIVIADESMSDSDIRCISSCYETVTTVRTAFPFAFACPVGVSRVGNSNSGSTEPLSPWGDAVAEH